MAHTVGTHVAPRAGDALARLLDRRRNSASAPTSWVRPLAEFRRSGRAPEDVWREAWDGCVLSRSETSGRSTQSCSWCNRTPALNGAVGWRMRGGVQLCMVPRNGGREFRLQQQQRHIQPRTVRLEVLPCRVGSCRMGSCHVLSAQSAVRAAERRILFGITKSAGADVPRLQDAARTRRR